METGQLSVLASRVARASYGVRVREVYSPARHFDEEVLPDLFNPKKLYAVNQIQWMIQKVWPVLTGKYCTMMLILYFHSRAML